MIDVTNSTYNRISINTKSLQQFKPKGIIPMFTCGLVRSKTAYVRAMLRTPAALRLFLSAACSGLMLPELRPCRAVRRNGAIDLNAVDMLRRWYEIHNAGPKKRRGKKNIWTVGEGKIAQRRIRRSGVSADEIFVSSPALRAFALCRLETCCLAAVERASRDWSLYFTRKDSQMGTYKHIMHRQQHLLQ